MTDRERRVKWTVSGVLVLIGVFMAVVGLAYAGTWPVAFVVLGSRTAASLQYLVLQGAGLSALGGMMVYAALRRP